MAKATFDLVANNGLAYGLGHDKTRLGRLIAGLGGLRQMNYHAASTGSPAAAHHVGEVTASPKPVCRWQHVAPFELDRQAGAALGPAG
jgi:hypothetical protein